MGPAHNVRLSGLSVSGADAFATPLGAVAVDGALRRRALDLPGMLVSDCAHVDEHALEVQLPFLQRVLGAIRIVPLLVGNADTDEVAGVLEALWGGPETLVVISSDLSHYHDQATATGRDRRTAAAIVARMAERVGDDDACGARPIRGLLAVARRRGLDL